MAVDEDDVQIVHHIVKFDGDWAKAAAIDAALTYGLLAVRLKRNRIESQLSGNVPIDADDFTVITAIFEEVLGQRGYVVRAKDVESLLETLAERLTDRNHHLAEVNDKKDENLDKQAEEINELQEKNLQLHEELAVAQAEIAQLRQLRAKLLGSYDPEEPVDTFKASPCKGQNPYRASNGAPCISSFGASHQDETGFRWSADNGVNEKVARSLQVAYARTGRNFVFQRSLCNGLHPYHTEDGIPCVLGPEHEERPHMGKTVDGMDVYWYDHLGVDEVTARSLQLASQPK